MVDSLFVLFALVDGLIWPSMIFGAIFVVALFTVGFLFVNESRFGGMIGLFGGIGGGAPVGITFFFATALLFNIDDDVHGNGE